MLARLRDLSAIDPPNEAAPVRPADGAVVYVCRARRVTRGNLWVPDRATLTATELRIAHRGLWRSQITTLALRHVSRTVVNYGLLYGRVEVESAGHVVQIAGLARADAKRLAQLIDQLTTELNAGS